MSYRERLLSKLKILSETVWERKAREPQIQAWLDNFVGDVTSTEKEQLHALYLLSRFMYFGSRQIRELMKVLFRDLYRYPIVEEIRRTHNDTMDSVLINSEFESALEQTLFLGVGNPSESGNHLLYLFRQENGLPTTRFVHSHEVFQRGPISFSDQTDNYTETVTLRHPQVNRYVFIDDFCGSGQQGAEYSQSVVEDIKILNSEAKVFYFILFATTRGMESLRENTKFDEVHCIFELDESFRCFSPSSRIFSPPLSDGISSDCAERISRFYGEKLEPDHPLGYGNCQLLIGFHHNTPDNTLPVFWYDESSEVSWTPIFRRYPKIYSS